MKKSDEAIVIQRMSYSETSLLVRVFTKQDGLLTLLFQGGKKKWGNILYPLAQVEVVYYRRSDSQMGKISSVQLSQPAVEIPFDPLKSSVAFFLAEFLQQLMRDEHPDETLFDLIQEETEALEHCSNSANFPLWICSQLAEFTGIHPQLGTEPYRFLDLKEGMLDFSHPLHGHFLQGEFLKWMNAVNAFNRNEFLALSIPKVERTACFEAWLVYLQFHFPNSRNLKSVAVLKEVFS